MSRRVFLSDMLAFYGSRRPERFGAVQYFYLVG
jgi:hypothetical protein